MKKFLNEFKEFAMRGNVIDLAVGVIIGAAMKDIVNSLVNDLLSPLLGLIGYVDMKEWFFAIGSAQIMYGSFLTAVVNFIIMSFFIFLFVKGVNKIRTISHADPATDTRTCPYCLETIPGKATRCKFCTAELPAETEQPAAD